MTPAALHVVLAPDFAPLSPKNRKHLHLSTAPGGRGALAQQEPPSYAGRAANLDPEPSFYSRSSVRFANLKILLASRAVICCVFCHSKNFPKGHAKFTPERPGSDNRLLAAPSVPPSPHWLLCWGAKDISFPAPCEEEVTPATSSSRRGTPRVFLPIQVAGWDVRKMWICARLWHFRFEVRLPGIGKSQPRRPGPVSSPRALQVVKLNQLLNITGTWGWMFLSVPAAFCHLWDRKGFAGAGEECHGILACSPHRPTAVLGEVLLLPKDHSPPPLSPDPLGSVPPPNPQEMGTSSLHVFVAKAISRLSPRLVTMGWTRSPSPAKIREQPCCVGARMGEEEEDEVSLPWRSPCRLSGQEIKSCSLSEPQVLA